MQVCPSRELLINGNDTVKGFCLSPTLAEYFLTVDVSRIACMTDIPSMREELLRVGLRIDDTYAAKQLFKMLRLRLCLP